MLVQLQAFAKAGYEVIGVSAPGPRVREIEEAGVEHIPLKNATRAFSALRDAAAFWEFFRLCRRLKPDIVHTHNPKPGIYGRLAARLAKVPIVVNTVHGLYALPDDRWIKRALFYTLERLSATCSDAELVQNDEDMPVLRQLRIPNARLHVLGNGIDLGRFNPDAWPSGERQRVREEIGATESTIVLGFVGRLVGEKGYRDFFAALQQLYGVQKQLDIWVIGAADPDKSDALIAGELEWAERELGVKFLGWRYDVDRLYLGMDIFVFASHREGWPRAVMEASAMGLPIIATNIRGCRQVVEHGVNGILVPQHQPSALAEAISRVASDDDLRDHLGTAGRAKAVSDFDLKRQIARTLRVYASLSRATSAPMGGTS